MSATQDNKKIAKNTLFLYFRMLLVMVVTLYTSRVVLHELGIDDYGIYSVIGGVVSLFAFFNLSVCTSTQRYITYELGRPDGDVSKVFSACMKVHIWMSLLILLVSETIGLWFINNKMVFPDGSIRAVNWVYQLSILSCIATVLKFPYNALVLAHERMSFYAYNSIAEVLLKLVIVFLLTIFPSDKLVWYILMLLMVTILITLWYALYCKIQFPNIKYVKVTDKKLYTSIVAFSGWASFGGLANMGYQQGVNIIVNIFYGVALNATIGIATQVNSAVSQFVNGFQQAINPQLIKSEASGEKNRQVSLIYTSSKFSFLIMLIISYPLICNIDYVLGLWLGNCPPFVGVITSLVIIGALIESISGPLWVTIYATGKIHSYQILISIVLLLNLPLSYICSHMGMAVWNIYLIRIGLFVTALAVRLMYLRNLITLNIGGFLKKVVAPLLAICSILGLNEMLLVKYIGYANNFQMFLLQTLYLISFSIIIIYIIGVSKSEASKLKSMVFKRFSK